MLEEWTGGWGVDGRWDGRMIPQADGQWMAVHRWVYAQLLIMIFSTAHTSGATRHTLWTCQGHPLTLAPSLYSTVLVSPPNPGCGSKNPLRSLHMGAWVSCPSGGLTLIIPSKFPCMRVKMTVTNSL